MGYELIWSGSVSERNTVLIPKGTKLYPYTQFMVEVIAKSGITVVNTNNYGGSVYVQSYNPFSSSSNISFISIGSDSEGTFRLNRDITSKTILSDDSGFKIKVDIKNNVIKSYIANVEILLDYNGNLKNDTVVFRVENSNYQYSSFTGTFIIKLYGNKI